MTTRNDRLPNGNGVQTAKLRPGGYCEVNAKAGDTVRIVARREGEFDYVVIPAEPVELCHACGKPLTN